MPFNGSGSFSPPGSSFPAVSNTLIEAEKFNAIINDICTNGLSNCITKDGQTTLTNAAAVRASMGLNLTAKGSILVGDGGSPSQKSVGPDGQVLVADSSQSDGLAWGSANGVFRQLRVYTSSTTWTKSSDLKRVKVTVVGGGGAGAGAAATSGTQCSVGQGGGGGGASIKSIEAASLGETESVTVGAGGAAGSAGASGADGGTSSFGSHCSATGGAGGAVGGPTTELNLAGQSGGVGSGGDINLQGGPSSAVVSWGAHFVVQSVGGHSFLGQPTRAVSGSSNGGNAGAAAYGAGGTGGSNDISQSAKTAGNGGSGIVIVEEFY